MGCPDPVFIEQFLLVYRRFATPRSLLLGLQKRIRALSSTSEDTLLAKFAQMRCVISPRWRMRQSLMTFVIRMCALLETWLTTYPGDFASHGAEPALRAIIRQILSNSHTAHYAVDLMPFLQSVSDLADEDKEWGVKEKMRDGTSEDGPSSDNDPAEADVDIDPMDLGAPVERPRRDPEDDFFQPHDLCAHNERPSTVTEFHPPLDATVPSKGTLDASSAGSPPLKPTSPPNGSGRFRAISVTGKEGPPAPEARMPWFAEMGTVSTSRGPRGPDAPRGTKASFKELKNASNAIAQIDPIWVAQEITRLEVPLFLAVEVCAPLLRSDPSLTSPLIIASRLAPTRYERAVRGSNGPCTANGSVL